MHIDLHQARVPNVGETVHLAGFHDEDRARADLELLAFDHVSRPPFANEQNLIVRMAMGLWATARFPFEETGDICTSRCSVPTNSRALSLSGRSC
jgi:hypothetical protein